MAVSHNVRIDGLAQLTYGLVGNEAGGAMSISGYGLVTFGFLWGVADIWTDVGDCQVVTWDDCPCTVDCQ